MLKKYVKELTENKKIRVEAEMHKGNADIKAYMDDRHLITAIVDDEIIDVDVREPLLVLKTPLLTKIALRLKSIADKQDGKKRKLKIRKDFFKRIFFKD